MYPEMYCRYLKVGTFNFCEECCLPGEQLEVHETGEPLECTNCGKEIPSIESLCKDPNPSPLFLAYVETAYDDKGWLLMNCNRIDKMNRLAQQERIVGCVD